MKCPGILKIFLPLFLLYMSYSCHTSCSKYTGTIWTTLYRKQPWKFSHNRNLEKNAYKKHTLVSIDGKKINELKLTFMLGILLLTAVDSCKKMQPFLRR